MWTSGETIVASRLLDVPANKLMGGDVIAAFNLLKIYSTNIFDETLGGTGDIVESLANGTLQATCPANSDTASTFEIDTIALSTSPRIVIFRINNITLYGSETSCFIGLGDNSLLIHKAVLVTYDGGTTWTFRTQGTTTATSTNVPVPVAGDVFTIYATSSRCSLFRNGTHVATHTTNLPTNTIGHILYLDTIANQGAGSQITLGFMG